MTSKTRGPRRGRRKPPWPTCARPISGWTCEPAGRLVNGVSRGGWVRHAARLEQAGADALELNVYYVSSSPGQSGSEVEWRYLDKVLASHRSRG